MSKGQRQLQAGHVAIALNGVDALAGTPAAWASSSCVQPWVVRNSFTRFVMVGFM